MVAQVFVLGAACGGLWLALRWMRAEFARVDGEIRRTERMLGKCRPCASATLRFDPVTGHYHPAEN